MFGAPVVVQVDSQSQGPANIADVVIPSLEEGKFGHAAAKSRRGELMAIHVSRSALLSFLSPSLLHGCGGHREGM